MIGARFVAAALPFLLWIVGGGWRVAGGGRVAGGRAAGVTYQPAVVAGRPVWAVPLLVDGNRAQVERQVHFLRGRRVPKVCRRHGLGQAAWMQLMAIVATHSLARSLAHSLTHGIHQGG